MLSTRWPAVALAFLLFGFSTPSFAAVCKYADSAVAKVTTGTMGAGVLTGAGLKAAGVMAVEHIGGAAIVHAGGGYVASTLGAVGAGVGFLTAPATLVIGGTAVVAAGGTIAYCQLQKRSTPVARPRRR